MTPNVYSLVVEHEKASNYLSKAEKIYPIASENKFVVVDKVRSFHIGSYIWLCRQRSLYKNSGIVLTITSLREEI